MLVSSRDGINSRMLGSQHLLELKHLVLHGEASDVSYLLRLDSVVLPVEGAVSLGIMNTEAPPEREQADFGRDEIAKPKLTEFQRLIRRRLCGGELSPLSLRFSVKEINSRSLLVL